MLDKEIPWTPFLIINIFLVAYFTANISDRVGILKTFGETYSLLAKKHSHTSRKRQY